jgi:small subunit ribosomal protein S2
MSNPTPSGFSADLLKLLEAGVHFGHQSRRWHPKMQPFIWQERDGVHIFDLLKTAECIKQAQEAIKQDIIAGKNIVYVGTKRQASPIIKEEAERAGVPYVVSRWAGGTMTNWSQVKKSIERLTELKEGLAKNKFNQYTKKERVLLDKEVTRLERLFGGLEGIKSPPEVLFIVDIAREKAAVKEAKMMGIKIYALIDSNANPELVDYPIPGNDDAVRSIKLLVSLFTDAVIEGKALAAKDRTVK